MSAELWGVVITNAVVILSAYVRIRVELAALRVEVDALKAMATDRLIAERDLTREIRKLFDEMHAMRLHAAEQRREG